MDWIWGLSCEPSSDVTEQAMIGLDTPQARPNAVKEKTQYLGSEVVEEDQHNL